jgi:hypothetical protein
METSGCTEDSVVIAEHPHSATTAAPAIASFRLFMLLISPLVLVARL